MDSIRTLILAGILGLGARTVGYVSGIATDVAELKTTTRENKVAFDDEKASTDRRLDRLETVCLVSTAKPVSIP